MILKAAYLATSGGESEAIVSEIESKCFERLRSLLRMWKEYHDKLFPDREYSGPSAELCSLFRLAGGGALQSDTCNAARKAKRLLRELAQSQAEEWWRGELGDAAWEALSDEARNEKLRMHLLDCHQHIRNIFLGHMSRKLSEHMKQELAHQLQAFASWERMSTDFDQLLRGCYKDFHHGCNYYKGHGADFTSWMLEHYPDSFYMLLERAEGGRQDLDFDASVPIYMDRQYYVEYLQARVYSRDHILDDFLFKSLTTEQFIASSRANAVIDLRVSRHLRWLSGKSAELTNWSPLKNNWALELVEAVFEKAKDDGSVLLDPELDIFQPITNEQPLFRAYLKHMFEHDAVLSPNGKTRHLHYKLALAELLTPQDATNARTTAKTIEYLEVQAAAGLEKMHDAKLAIADKLTSQGGTSTLEKQPTMHTDTMGCHADNNLSEATIGAWKYERRRIPGISMRRASGLAHERVAKSMAREVKVLHRKRRQPSSRGVQKQRSTSTTSTMFGFFHRLPVSEQVALIEMARCERKAQRRLDQEDGAELDAHRRLCRKTNSQLELESLIKQFALALSFFDRYTQRGVTSVGDLNRELRSLKSDQEKLDWLREQIEMRVIGFGWVEYKTQWSSGRDEGVGSVSDLIGQLKEILEAQADRDVPEAAVAPIMQRKTFKELGTPTVQAEQLAHQRLSLSEEELLAAAERERERQEACGELDTVGDRQPSKAPPLDESLIGRKVEIHWRYWRPTTEAEQSKAKGKRKAPQKKQVFIWCEGTIEEVSDGTIRQSKRHEDALPAGAVRIRWPADADHAEKETLVWSILNPEDWCKPVHLGWRWAPSELARVAEEAASGRKGD